MTLFKTCFFVLSGLLYPFLIWSKTTGRNEVSAVIVPLYVLSVLAYAFISARTSGNLGEKIPFILSFLLILVGDCILNWTPWELQGLFPFAAAHFLLGLYFLSLAGRRGKDLLSALPAVAVSLVFFIRFSPALGSRPLSIVLAAYLSVLSFMAWRATEVFFFRGLSLRFRLAVFTGALCFYVSDLLVLLNSIEPPPWGTAAAWVLYPPALFLLSLSSGMNKNKRGSVEDSDHT